MGQFVMVVAAMIFMLKKHESLGLGLLENDSEFD